MYTTDDSARKAALKAKKKMKNPKDWKIEVDTDGILGWHWKLINKMAMVTHGVNQDDGYWCMISDNSKEYSGGSSLWTEGEYFDSPQKAFEDERKKALKVINELNNVGKVLKGIK